MGAGVKYGEQISDAPAMLYAAILGPLTTATLVIGWFTIAGWEHLPFDPQFTLGYYIGAALSFVVGVVWFILIAGLVAMIGLVMFGRPVASRAGERLVTRWWALFALIYGAIAGGVLAVVGFRLLGFDGEALALGAVFGAPFGAPTGFWFWFFYRRVLLARAALENEP